MSLVPEIIIKNKDVTKIATGSIAMAEKLVYGCIEMLLRHYPGHPWHVSISKDMSVLGIRLLNLHENYGMILHTTQVQNDPDLKELVRSGGELLERASQVRGKFREDPVEFDLSECPTKRLVDKDVTIKKVLLR